MTERFAIFYAPSEASLLWQRAAQWLGRDAAGRSFEPGEPPPGVDAGIRFDQTRSARRYGFHATLKPPMALAPGRTRAGLETALADFALTHRPVRIGRLNVASLGGFVALMPEIVDPELTAFAGECVAAFDAFRAPMSTEEREHRLPGLSAYQIGLLDHFGYPYVMDQFRFHMTLTDRLTGRPDAEAVTAAAREWFAPTLAEPFLLDRLALFHEPEPGAPFMRVADFPLSSKVPP